MLSVDFHGRKSTESRSHAKKSRLKKHSSEPCQQSGMHPARGLVGCRQLQTVVMIAHCRLIEPLMAVEFGLTELGDFVLDPDAAARTSESAREPPVVWKLDRRIRARHLEELDRQPRCELSVQGRRGDSFAVCHLGRKLIGATAAQYWRSTFAGPNRATTGGVHSIKITNAEFVSRSLGTLWAAFVPEFPTF